MSLYNGQRVNGIGKDVFGVEWSKEGSAVDAALPKPGSFILDDIRRWRDVVKFPDFSGVDWEMLAKEDLKDCDPSNPRGGSLSNFGFFQAVMAFMGFTEGLIACVEEPEEVKDLVNYLCDGFLSQADHFLKYYQPQYIWFADDIATERAPFISMETFHDIFAPVWRRYIKYFKDRGYLAVIHNCGHFETFLDDVVDMGFNAWDPAQRSNDLATVKKKFGNKLMICGGLNTAVLLPHMDVTEDQVRGVVRNLLDELAPGGGYAFLSGGAGGPMDTGDPMAVQRLGWVNDEFEKIRGTYY
jgi:hypothetical protein